MNTEQPKSKFVPRDSHERVIIGRSLDQNEELTAKKLKDYRKAVWHSNIGRARRGEPLR